MINELKYKTTIKTRDYMYPYLKKAISLHLNGATNDDIKKKALEDNIFQVTSETRKKEIVSTVLQRMAALDDYLMNVIVNETLETSKLVALYVIVKGDRLFFEFMNEVFKDKLFIGELILLDKDFNLFFQAKATQSEVIASWSDYTYYKLQQVYIRILFEAGLLNNKKEDRQIIIPLLDPEVRDYIRNKGDGLFLEAMGVN